MALNLTNTFLQGHSCPPVLPPKKVSNVVGSGSFRPVVTCRKKEIHPEFYEDAKVYCKGELVMTTGGTQKEYVVDIWSGNHPFYLGNRSGLLVDDDQVEKFRKKYGGLTEIMDIPVLKGEIVLPSRKKGAGKGGKKK
ncbi:large ribosomal subunit protein bL31c [Rosa sericea]